MPDTAVLETPNASMDPETPTSPEGLEPTQVPEAVEPEHVVGGTPRLDAIMAEIYEIHGAEETEGEPPAEEAPPAEVLTQEMPPQTQTETPATFDIESLLKDPRYESQVKSELDKRAAGLAKAQREQVQREEQARIQAEAQAQAEQDYARLVELAASDDDLSDEVQNARKQLAQKQHINRLYETWYKNTLPTVQTSVQQQVADQIASNLIASYTRAYTRIPELQNPETFGKVTHDKFPTADDWLVNLIDTVSAQRLEAEREKLLGEASKQAQTLADAQTTQRMAEHRATLPVVDTSPSQVGTRAGIDLNSVTQIQIETLFANDDPRVTPDMVRWVRDNRPYS